MSNKTAEIGLRDPKTITVTVNIEHGTEYITSFTLGDASKLITFGEYIDKITKTYTLEFEDEDAERYFDNNYKLYKALYDQD